MTNDDWASTLTARVADQIRRSRKAAGLTVAELAAACEDLGMSIPKATLHNLETGRRSSLEVPELLVLAKAVGIPPISLLFPLGEEPHVKVLPWQEVHAWDAVAWFCGETRATDVAPEGSARALLDVFREHDAAAATALVSTNLARERRQKATIALDPTRRQHLQEAAAGYERLAFDDCRSLQHLRADMRAEGLTPPDLPEELAFVDQDDADDEDHA